MKTVIETLLLALVDAAEDKAHRMEWSCCGDACCKPVEEAADRLIMAAREVRQHVVDNHVPCREYTGCTLCEREFGIPAHAEAEYQDNWAKAEALLAGPQPGTYAYTARIMADICPDFDWDAWKDEMKEGAL